MVIVASGIGSGRVRTTTTESRNMVANTETRQIISVGFLWLGPIDSGVDEISSKNEREREESRARINRDRSSQEDRERERARLKERRRK